VDDGRGDLRFIDLFDWHFGEAGGVGSAEPDASVHYPPLADLECLDDAAQFHDTADDDF
jgi:hypothetical protein